MFDINEYEILHDDHDEYDAYEAYDAYDDDHDDNDTEDEKYNLITKQQPVVIVDMGPDVASLEDYENGLNGKENAIKTMDNCIDNLNESCIYSIMFFLIGFVLFSSIYVKI